SAFTTAAVDLGGEPAGLDEAVFLIPESRSLGPRIFVQKLQTAGSATSFGDLTNPVTLDRNTDNPQISRPQLKIADVDGDGKADIVVLGVFDGRAGLRVFKNTGSGTLDANQFIPVEGLPSDAQLMSFATLNLDDDPQLEIAVATSKGVFF